MKHRKENCTYINHHSLFAELAQRHGGVDSTPVELHRASNAVDTTSKHNDAMVVEGDIVGGGIVRSVQVVSICTSRVSMSHV